MAGNLQPTPAQQRLLEALARPNQRAKTGEEDWWPPLDLTRQEGLPDTVQAVTRIAVWCVRKGVAAQRRIGTATHGWTEYRITSTGRAVIGGYPDQQDTATATTEEKS